MTSRQTGRRMASMSSQQRRSVSRVQSIRGGARRQKSEPLAAKDIRRLAQVVACGAVFVALVAAKLLLPARMAEFNEKLSAVMEQNMDVQAVFSAVGRAFSGEEGVGVEEVYQTVFHPQEGASAQETASSWGEDSETAAPPEEGGLFPLMKTSARTLKLQEDGALAVLRSYRVKPSSPEDSAAPSSGLPESEAAPQSASNLAYVLYSQENLPEGVSMEQTILGFDYCAPVKGALSSGFGYREHPVEGEERFHYGVDLAADSGTEVDCFADGTVTAVGESSSYGRYCIVAHDGGFSTLYAHCSRIIASSGTAVRRGQKIAEVGETGMATGPHLHFELQHDGTYLNPIYYVSSL